MTDRPQHDNNGPTKGKPPRANDAFEEALDAAEVFSELAQESPGASSAAQSPAHIADNENLPGDDVAREETAREDAAFADEFDLRRSVARAEAALDAAETSLLGPAPDKEAEPPRNAAPPQAVAPEGEALAPPPAARPAERVSIGLLFRAVVKHSPPSKIRIESDSIGALFRRFIEQE